MAGENEKKGELASSTPTSTSTSTTTHLQELEFADAAVASLRQAAVSAREKAEAAVAEARRLEALVRGAESHREEVAAAVAAAAAAEAAEAAIAARAEPPAAQRSRLPRSLLSGSLIDGPASASGAAPAGDSPPRARKRGRDDDDGDSDGNDGNGGDDGDDVPAPPAPAAPSITATARAITRPPRPSAATTHPATMDVGVRTRLGRYTAAPEGDDNDDVDDDDDDEGRGGGRRRTRGIGLYSEWPPAREKELLDRAEELGVIPQNGGVMQYWEDVRRRLSWHLTELTTRKSVRAKFERIEAGVERNSNSFTDRQRQQVRYLRGKGPRPPQEEERP